MDVTRQPTRPSPAVPVPRRDVPQPAALRNAVRPDATRQRKPVRDQGYMRRVPLGRTKDLPEDGPVDMNALQAMPAQQGRQTVQRPAAGARPQRTIPQAGQMTENDARSDYQPYRRQAIEEEERELYARDDGSEDEYDDYEAYDEDEDRQDRGPRLWLGLLILVLLLCAGTVVLLLTP